jgi:2-keto-4-pentenoate hydratase/2-oxohepta-3-ene-1,7-dioic acid hydratase in catechol pathway
MLSLIAAMVGEDKQRPAQDDASPFVYDVSRLMHDLRSTNDAELETAGVLVPLDKAVLLAPIPNPPSNIICLGRNYPEHAVESALARGEQVQVDRPNYPNIFTKATSSINGPFSPIPYDSLIITQIDYEGELAVIIGKPGKNITLDQAMSHVFGYTILNDVTARDIQKRHGGQFFKGKSLDGACPMGPWIVTADEIPDPRILEIEVQVNGDVKQHDTVASMFFSVPEIIQEVSVGMTLHPGDIISTGTPSGVGFARNPQEFLRPGDIVQCTITAIGSIRNEVRAIADSSQ